ncbi:murein hydrolase activator EnvC family protein [Microbacterium sp. NPDC055683]
MRRLAAILALGLLALACVAAGSPGAARARAAEPVAIETAEQWSWPVSQDVRIVAPFEAPPHRYGPGHRGVDLAADAGPILAPASGVVAFAGSVAGRPLLTIDHGDGLVTTLEPVEPLISAGDAVARGDQVGTLATGGHTPAGAVHFGVRLHGEYINPLLLLDGVPRAVLLPCCG